MRICFSLVTLLAVIPATPVYASLGSAPLCVPYSKAEDFSVRLPLSELNQRAKKVDAEDRDYLIRTMVFEAGTETDEGKAAVAYVILNREKIGRWGNNIREVVTAPWQFEPWMTKRKQIESLSRSDPSYRDAARVADAVLSGEIADPTAGATHFLNPTIVRQRRGGSLPAWASSEGKPIGRHTFYRPEEETPMVDLLTVATDMYGSVLSRSPQDQQAEDVYGVGLPPLA